MRSNLLSLVICLTSIQAFAQLQPGNIAFLSMQCDAPDGFAFVTLTDIPGNTSISFTDNGWSGTALFTSSENTLTWTAPASGVPMGVVVIMREDTIAGAGHSTELVTGPGTASGELGGLALGGDQILAYVGTSANPSFIAAISVNLFLPVCNTIAAGNSNFTCLPAPLEEGINAIAVTGDSTGTENAYVFMDNFSGSATDVLAMIMDPENWSYDNDPAVGGFDMWPPWTFSFSVPDPSEISFQTGFLTMAEGASAQTINFSISPASFGSQVVTITLSGNANSGDLQAIPGFNGTAINLNIPNGSTTASISLAAITDILPEGTETGTLTISSVSPGLLIGAGNVLNFEITEVAGVSYASFTSSSQTITEGESAITVNVDVLPAPTTAQSFNIQLNELNGLNSSDYSTNPTASLGLINVSLAAGETSFSFTFTAVDDASIESPEELSISLIDLSSGLQAGLNATASLILLDNDAAPVVSGLYINEVMASNTSTIADENGEFDDWIEIYNDALTPADLAGLFITDDLMVTNKYQFPIGSASTVIAPGDFKLVWADNSSAQGPLHTNFTLSPAGEYVGLYASNGDLIDSLSYEALGPNESFGYDSDFNGELIVFEDGFTTPNESNALSAVIDVQTIEMNIFPNPADAFSLMNMRGLKGTVDVHIFAVSGNLVAHQTLTEGTTQIVLSTSSLSSGVYLVRIGSGKNRIYKKLIIAH